MFNFPAFTVRLTSLFFVKMKWKFVKEYSINEPLGKILRDINSFDADILAFSVYIWNIEMMIELSKKLKQLYVKITKILEWKYPLASFPDLSFSKGLHQVRLHKYRAGHQFCDIPL